METFSLQPANHSLAEKWPVIAMGTACITALTLRRAGLIQKPMPFDWIWSSPPMVRHCLDTDFAFLLDRSHYRSITGDRPENEPFEGCEHEFYAQAFSMPPIFNHNDPTRETDYRYLTSCVDRFRDVISSQHPKLFVQMGEFTDETVEDFKSTCDVLDRLTRQAAFLQIAVSPPDSLRRLPKLDVLSAQGGHTVYHMKPTSRFGGERFHREMDNEVVTALIANYGRYSAHAFKPEDHVAPGVLPNLVDSLDLVSVMAHIADRGDTGPDENGWTGVCGCGLEIQGLCINVDSSFPPGVLSYQVAITPAEFTEWVTPGTYLGTRGLGKPIYGLRLSAAPELLTHHRVSLELSFVDGSRVGPIAQCRTYECLSSSPLEAIRILAVEHDNEAEHEQNRDTTKIILRCGI